MLYDILIIRIFLGLLLIILLTQSIKIIIESIKSKKFKKSCLFLDGGFPSTHSALVSGLTSAIFFETGFSYLFLITAVFSLIIIRDSFGLRLQVGKQKQILEKLDKKDSKILHLQREGHTIIQVLSGIFIGLAIMALVLSF